MLNVIILVVALLCISLFILRAGNKDTMSRKDKRELARLRTLKYNLTELAMQNALSDPFAHIVLDEIMNHERSLEE